MVYCQKTDSLINFENYLDTNRISYTKSDTLIFFNLIDSLKNNAKDTNISIIDIASYFIDKKYGSGNRGKKSENKILINLSELDCVTYVESVLAIYKTTKYSKRDFCLFAKEVENIKYRNGIKILFPSRLHYFTEWLADNTKRGNIKDITSEIDSVKYNKPINYMSKNRNLYPQLKDSSYYNEMKVVENNLNNNQHYYLPKNKFDDYKPKIKHGNIIVFTSTTEGLDVSHVGFAYWKNNELYLLHASSKYNKVLISTSTLKEYLNQNSKVSGIMVADVL
ncbi:MAG: hypothetical protein A2046_00955 [Bacteroidetes bacterium GWA2_30_7]|nr:MAG: hypothetical protein A2046_00955 [Bacteroidetes bacterium GWA2_30_7]